jgi:hypothetical protein
MAVLPIFIAFGTGIYGYLSATNLWPRCTPTGFVPPQVPVGSHWGLRNPVIAFSAIVQLHMKSTSDGVPYCLYVRTKDGEFLFSLRKAFPTERAAATEIIRRAGPPEAVEGLSRLPE